MNFKMNVMLQRNEENNPLYLELETIKRENNRLSLVVGDNQI